MAAKSYVMRDLPCSECGQSFWHAVPKESEYQAVVHQRPCDACVSRPAPDHILTINFGAEFQEYYHTTLGGVVKSFRDFDKQCENKGLYCLGGDVRRELDSISRNRTAGSESPKKEVQALSKIKYRGG